MATVGIDLGTTFSLIGQVNAAGVPALFPDLHDASEFRTPSVICFEGEGMLVGQTVEELQDEEPTLEILRHVKLEMDGYT